MSNKVIIHCNPKILNHWTLKNGNFSHTNNIETGEIDLIVDDLPYEIVNEYYQDPDEQLCENYSIPYDLVNCIEAL
jgi:hypothetical protein